jgi:hypothetical protein
VTGALERGRARRLLLLALVLSIVIHFVGGSVWAALTRRLKAPSERDIASNTQRITIQKLPPLPTPVPTPTPQPLATPTPLPTPTPTPRKQLLATLAPRAIAQRAPSKGIPHHPAIQHPTGIVATNPVHVPIAPPRIARHVELARPHAPGHRAPSALNPQQVASLDAKFAQTIAQAQHDVAQGPPTPTPGGLQTMKRYDPILAGTPDEVTASDAPCYEIAEPQRIGAYNYYWIHCTISYSDGFVDTVDIPWPFRFPVRNDPFMDVRARVIHFYMQAPPDGFVLPNPFPISRLTCAFYRERCEAVLARERANGTIDTYGRPP